VAGSLVAFLSVGAYTYTHPSGAGQFKRIFAMPVPPGVSNIVAKRPLMYIISMDTTVLLRFQATSDAIDTIVSARGLKADQERVEAVLSSTGSHAFLWKSAFGRSAEFGGSGWEEPILEDPVFYHAMGEPLINWKLLWDRKTNQAWALYLVG
jgi:hypothetical protein